MTDIPALRHLQEMPPVRNAADLCLRWRALMDPLGSSQPSAAPPRHLDVAGAFRKRRRAAGLAPDDLVAPRIRD